MKLTKPIITLVTVLMIAVLAGPVMAGQPDGKGNGDGKDKDTSPGGNGFNTPSPISLTISFRDNYNDGIQSDDGSYSDESADLAFPLDAHIDGDSGGSYGNLFLRTTHTDPANPRTLYLDIASGCVDGCDHGSVQNQPFQTASFHILALNLAATESIAGGLCGMQTGQTITAPMQIDYADPEIYGTEAPGFIDFFPVTRGKSPCKGSQASEVTVIRNDTGKWTVSGGAACVTWPGGREFGGVTVMPFEFTASIEASETQICD
jgi:hypothetical protein